ncbi:MAG: small conductance mechanosensitive channel [Candidatus Krumholzibacteriia bacterium]|jgi:small conductance mechanosensitive channel
MKRATRTLAVFFVLASLLFPVSVFAQDAADDSAVSLEKGRVALDGITEIVVDYRQHRAAMTNASAEDSLVLELQIDAVIEKFIAELPNVASLYPVEAANDSERSLQTDIEFLFTDVNASLWELIATKRNFIDRLRAQRMQSAPSERGALEFSIALLTDQLNRLTSYVPQHLKAQQAMGHDLTEPTATYHTLLDERADETVGRIMLSGERIMGLQAQLKDQAGDADLSLLLTTTNNVLSNNVASLELLTNLMDEEDLATTEYRALLITVSQDIAAGLLNTKVIATLARRAWQSTTGWLKSNGAAYLIKILVFSIILFVGRLLAKLVRKAVRTSLDRARINISQLLKRTIVSTAYNMVFALATMVALTQLGIDLGPLLAGFGVIGFILGFAMQDSLSNFASGLMILFYRPYDVGDLVDISGVFGKVENMSLVSTSILTLDNQKLIVPNSKIWGDVIKNVTDQNIRRVDMVFGISYSDDIPQVEGILEDILSKHDMVLENPESMVKLHKLNDSSVDFIVRPWVKTADYWDVYWDVTREVKMRFDAESVSIPFPQQDVHLHTEPQNLQMAANSSEAPANSEHTKNYQVTEAPDADGEA